MGWDRASKTEYDSWATFSSPNSSFKWDFESLLPYFIKTESLNTTNFDFLPGVSKAGYATAKAAYNYEDGFAGPVSVNNCFLILSSHS